MPERLRPALDYARYRPPPHLRLSGLRWIASDPSRICGDEIAREVVNVKLPWAVLTSPQSHSCQPVFYIWPVGLVLRFLNPAPLNRIPTRIQPADLAGPSCPALFLTGHPKQSPPLPAKPLAGFTIDPKPIPQLRHHPLFRTDRMGIAPQSGFAVFD